MQIYWCSVFILPKSVSKEIDEKCRNFLWKGNDDKGRGLVAWKDICLPKKDGGLGISRIWKAGIWLQLVSKSGGY